MLDINNFRTYFSSLLKAVVLSALVVLGVSCSQHREDRYAVAYRSVEGPGAVLVGGRARAPRQAPPEVKRAIAAANRLVGLPYKWGGGHARLNDNGYDCSGAASYVLRHAGLLEDQMPSRGFLRYGRRGRGKWITVYARNGHVFLVIAGLRFDTHGTTRRDGPRWRPKLRSTRGHAPRHPPGL